MKFEWEYEIKPEQWRVDTLHQIHKKGSTTNLDNYRFIHTKSDLSKCFGLLVTNTVKEKIIKSFSKFQIGAVPGHRPQEHLFCIRSLISLFQVMKKPLILSFFDISKFFDKEVLIDALDSCYDAGVRGKLYRLLYMMNSDTKIKIKTSVGMTDEEETGENISQGTVEGAILSASSIDSGVNKGFSKSSKEISYGEEKLLPFMYQDDVTRASDSICSLVAGNAIMDHIMNEKLLDLNIDK